MTTMDDLAAFIEARLDEDEAMAKAAYQHGPNPTQPLAPPEGSWWPVVRLMERLGSGTYNDANHIARHDPARVLREVAAKRAIVAEHGRDNFGCQSCQGDQRCPIPFLAAIWSDHPDYRAEWAAA
jgi:Family of unknown function (DUF6221)